MFLKQDFSLGSPASAHEGIPAGDSAVVAGSPSWLRCCSSTQSLPALLTKPAPKEESDQLIRMTGDSIVWDHPSVHLSIQISRYPYLHPSVYLFILHSTCPSIHSTISLLPVYPLIQPPAQCLECSANSKETSVSSCDRNERWNWRDAHK